MAIESRVERERVTETARQGLIALRTSGDLFQWYGTYFAQLGAKTLGKLINDEHLRIEAAAREMKRRMTQLMEERRAREAADPYSPANLARRGQPQGNAPSEWKRYFVTGPKEDRATLAEEDARSEDVQWSEGEGERAKRPSKDIDISE